MKLRIESDGTPQGTHVRNADTGELLTGVVGLTWWVEASSQAAFCTITLADAPVTLVGETLTEPTSRRFQSKTPNV